MSTDKKEGINFLVKARQGSRCKYSYDNKILELEGMLPKEDVYPEDYGIILQTTHDNGKPLDGFLLTDESIEPGAIVEARPTASIRTKENGIKNDKVLLVPCAESNFNNRSHKKESFEEIKDFIRRLGQIKGEEIEIKGSFGSDEAIRLINHCKKIYKRRKE